MLRILAIASWITLGLFALYCGFVTSYPVSEEWTLEPGQSRECSFRPSFSGTYATRVSLLAAIPDDVSVAWVFRRGSEEMDRGVTVVPAESYVSTERGTHRVDTVLLGDDRAYRQLSLVSRYTMEIRSAGTVPLRFEVGANGASSKVGYFSRAIVAPFLWGLWVFLILAWGLSRFWRRTRRAPPRLHTTDALEGT